jgi:hypothetical protein
MSRSEYPLREDEIDDVQQQYADWDKDGCGD